MFDFPDFTATENLCPWEGEDLGTWFATVKDTNGDLLCEGDTQSTFTLTSDGLEMQLCQSTGTPAEGIPGDGGK